MVPCPRGLKWLAALLLLFASCSRGTPVTEIRVSAGDVNARQADDFKPRAQDWTCWRGPNGNGQALSENAPTVWSESEAVVWSAPVPGRGHGSPVVCGDRIFLATADEAAEQQLVVALDRETGTSLWKTVVHKGGFPSDRQMHPKGTHANGTVACDDKAIFIAFLNHKKITTSALDFDGNILWQTELGAFKSKFGYAPSPIVYKGLVIFAADNGGGGYLAAVDRRSGKIMWRTARSRDGSYSTAVVANTSDSDQLLISGGNQVSSYDPSTGELNWSCEGTASATCGTIVWNDELVFASGGYPEKETLAIQSDGSGEVVWRNRQKSYEPSMLLAATELYSITDNGIAYCWNAVSGDLNWKKRLSGNFSASPVLCNGKIYVSNDAGMTYVFEANAEAYQQVAANQLGDDTYASPAICAGRLYLRVGEQANGKRQELLYCIE